MKSPDAGAITNYLADSFAQREAFQQWLAKVGRIWRARQEQEQKTGRSVVTGENLFVAGDWKKEMGERSLRRKNEIGD